MTNMNYKQLDKLDNVQDVLLALASYDWYFFNDTRIYGLMRDYKVTNKPSEIFTYYHGKKEHNFKLNNMRYVEQYKKILSAVIYS